MSSSILVRLIFLPVLIILLLHSTEGGRSGGGSRSSSRPSYSRPSYSRPSPSYSRPSPTYSRPTPTYSRPTPTYSRPSPTYSSPSPTYSRPTYHSPPPSYTKPTYVAPTFSSATHPVKPSAPQLPHNTGVSRPIGFVHPGTKPTGVEPSINKQQVSGSHATPGSPSYPHEIGFKKDVQPPSYTQGVGSPPVNPPPYTPGAGANPYNGQRPPPYTPTGHTYPGVSPSPIGGGHPNPGYPTQKHVAPVGSTPNQAHTYPGVSPSPIGSQYPHQTAHTYPGVSPSPIGHPNPGYPTQKYVPQVGHQPSYPHQTGAVHPGTYYRPTYYAQNVPGVPPGYSPTFVTHTHDNSMNNLATSLALYNLARGPSHHYYHDSYHHHNMYNRNPYYGNSYQGNSYQGDSYPPDSFQSNSYQSNAQRPGERLDQPPSVVSRPYEPAAAPPANCHVVDATATNVTNISMVSLNCTVVIPTPKPDISPILKALAMHNLGRNHQQFLQQPGIRTPISKGPVRNTTITPVNSTSSLLFSGLTVAYVRVEPTLMASVANITFTNGTIHGANGTITKVNGTIPGLNGTFPLANTTIPLFNVTVALTNVTLASMNDTIPSTNASIPVTVLSSTPTPLAPFSTTPNLLDIAKLSFNDTLLNIFDNPVDIGLAPNATGS